MAQWDVYPNPSARSRAELPYLVDVQSNLLADLPSRLTVPLACDAPLRSGLPQRLSPIFEIGGQRLLLVPHEAGAVPVGALRKPVASLRDRSHLVVDALDAVVSGV